MNGLVVKPITRAAKRRVITADPNGQRCLIENFSRKRAVHLAHVVDRDISVGKELMSSLEWNWGMGKGTLNLDTRDNMFFVGASMHELYEDRRWALIPEESVVRQYVDHIGLPLSRERFPKIEAENFRYTFVALDQMEDVAIVRQTSHPPTPQGFTYHLYPFEDFPVITSHIHPKFVIFHFGLMLAKEMSQPTRQRICATFSWLNLIGRLYLMWRSTSPAYAARDESYILVHRPHESPDEDLSEYSSEGDSVSTPRRCLRVYNHSRNAHLGQIRPINPLQVSTAEPMGETSRKRHVDIPPSSISVAPTPENVEKDSDKNIDPGLPKQSTQQALRGGRCGTNKRRVNGIDDDIEGSPPASRRRLFDVDAPPSTHTQSDDDSVFLSRWKADRMVSWIRSCSAAAPLLDPNVPLSPDDVDSPAALTHIL